MKRTIRIVSLFVLIVLVLGFSACGITATTGGNNANQTSGIWVTGEGKVTVTPDIALLYVGVETEADTVANAQQQANAAMDAVQKALKNNGIADNDIKTQYFSINPVRNYNPQTGDQSVTGYHVSNSLTVKIRKVNDAAKIIDAVTAAGGNNIVINGISFTVDDPTNYQKQAREKALENAKMKAQEIADKANLTLGDPTFLNETSGSNYGVVMQAALPAPVIASTSINTGETEITVYIQVAYSIK